MLVDVTSKQTFNVDIEPEEAFRILCKTLHMEFILEEDFNYFVTEDEYGEKAKQSGDCSQTRRIYWGRGAGKAGDIIVLSFVQGQNIKI